jgi:large subunit ribosomal protein L17
MFGNMVTSFFKYERIVTTKEKGKELKRISERLITRAKRNIGLPAKEEGRMLHNKREVMKVVKDKDVVKKLFDDIAHRFKDRKGGYTRIYLLGRRPGDAAEMSIVELIEKNIVTTKPEDKEVKKDQKAKPKAEVKKEAKKEVKKEVKKEAKKEPKKEARKEVKKETKKGKDKDKKASKETKDKKK